MLAEAAAREAAVQGPAMRVAEAMAAVRPVTAAVGRARDTPGHRRRNIPSMCCSWPDRYRLHGRGLDQDAERLGDVL